MHLPSETAASIEIAKNEKKTTNAAPLIGLPVVTFAPSMLQSEVTNTTEVDFGTALPNDKITRQISLRNSLPQQVRIVAISTTCGCLAAKPNDLIIGPSAATTIEVDLQTGGSEQEITKTITLALATVNTDGAEPLEFEMEVQVKTHVQNLLSFGRNQLLLDVAKLESNRGWSGWTFPGSFYPGLEIEGVRITTGFPG